MYEVTSYVFSIHELNNSQMLTTISSEEIHSVAASINRHITVVRSHDFHNLRVIQIRPLPTALWSRKSVERHTSRLSVCMSSM